MEITLTCKSCGKSFVFSEGEINYYKSNGLKPPKRCPVCRKDLNKDLREISAKMGRASQNIAGNRANDCGFYPVGVPANANISLKCMQIIVYIHDIPYYLRAQRLPHFKYVMLFLNSKENATRFDQDLNIAELLSITERRLQNSQKKCVISGHDVIYCSNLVNDTLDTEEFRSLQPASDTSSIWQAHYNYEYDWEQRHYRTESNLEYVDGLPQSL